MRRAWTAMAATAAALACAMGGCGGGSDVASASMALQTSGGLMASDVGAIELLVLDGAGATCARALAPVSPLDDESLVVVAHALFGNDGQPKHLSIPAGKKLVFYAEAFRSATSRSRLGRGCAEQQLGAGASAGVTILISADQQ
jgi:hypothetical protein